MSYVPKGSTHRRCYCRDPETNKPLGAACPKRTQRSHGSWSWKLELPAAPDGERQYAGRAGYSTKTDAQGDLDRARALLMIPAKDDEAGRHRISQLIVRTLKDEKQLPDFETTQRKFKANASLDQDLTLAEWLDIWLKNKKKLKKRAAARYETDIRIHLKPRIGQIKISKLTFNDLSQMFAGIAEANEEIVAGNTARRLVEERRKEAARNKVTRAEQRAIVGELRSMPPFRRITGPATQLRIRATLRTALNAAIPAGLIILNPAAHVELDPGAPVRPRMWTAARVENWQETGVKPYPVMVWTPEQLGAFLDHIVGHRLYAMFHLIAFRGLRRGEACGARLQDLELAGKALTIATQLVYDDWANVREDTPKTDSSDAPIALDSGTVAELRTWLARRKVEKEQAGKKWIESGRVFVTETGEWIHPGWLSGEFERQVRASGLPPVRLHDLRHCAATTAKAAGVDSKVIQEMLRHASKKTTDDTYTSVLPDLALDAAEKVAELVPRAAKTSGHASVTHEPPTDLTDARTDDAA